ncbi:MAG: DedA family protein, partial [Candidatus Methanoperedens sp.]|nr:DedA family protein [Candidatus Methanoperedens sp.]
MLESLQDTLLNYGYFGLFIASFLASTIFPFGSEGVLVYLVYENLNIPTLVLVASAGNYLGACTSYYIGLKGRGIVERYLRIDSKDIEKAEKYFSKYGMYIL